jgi:hypothetical protein
VRPGLLLLTALVLCAIAAPADAATRVRTYSPWTADGDPKLRRWFHGSGECTRSSFVNSRPQAWRCVSGNIVLDPCFQSPTDEEVLCVSSPWSRRGHLLSALLDPDTRGRSSARAPWAMRVGRARCLFIRRSGRARRRGRPTYRCRSGRNRSYLFGRPNRKRRTWTIRASSDRRGRGARRVRVRAAWL